MKPKMIEDGSEHTEVTDVWDEQTTCVKFFARLSTATQTSYFNQHTVVVHQVKSKIRGVLDVITSYEERKNATVSTLIFGNKKFVKVVLVRVAKNIGYTFVYYLRRLGLALRPLGPLPFFGPEGGGRTKA